MGFKGVLLYIPGPGLECLLLFTTHYGLAQVYFKHLQWIKTNFYYDHIGCQGCNFWQ